MAIVVDREGIDEELKSLLVIPEEDRVLEQDFRIFTLQHLINLYELLKNPPKIK